MSDFSKLLDSYPWMLQAGIVFIAMLVVCYLVYVLFKRIEERLKKTHILWDDSLVYALRQPLVFFSLLMGTTEIYAVLRADKVIPKLISLDGTREVGIIVLLTWFVLRYVSAIEQRVVSSLYMKKPIDKDSAIAIGKLMRSFVVIIAGFVLMNFWGFSISSLLAFGGIGGIIIGLAAKDLLANFFGGLIIYLDRPFKVGDWVRSSDKAIEGIVEEIGWRVTCIRSFDKVPLYIPNSAFSSIVIENPSRINGRRLNELIHIRHEDVDKASDIIADIREFLLSHSDVDISQKIMVHITSLAQSALTISIIVFTKHMDAERFALFKQDVLIKTMAIVSRHEAVLIHPAGNSAK